MLGTKRRHIRSNDALAQERVIRDEVRAAPATYRDPVAYDDAVVRERERYVEAVPAVTGTEVVRTRTQWSAGQLLALAVGIVATIFGGVALARTGLDFANVEATHTQVAGLHHTSVLALAELIFGLLAIASAVVPGGSRGLMAVLGLVGLGFGIVVLADSPSLHDTFGVHDGNGFLYIAYGIVLLLAAALPVYGTERATQRAVR